MVLERLRFISDLPWVLVTTYLPDGLVPDLAQEDLTNGSLYALMDRHGCPAGEWAAQRRGQVAGAALAQ